MTHVGRPLKGQAKPSSETLFAVLTSGRGDVVPIMPATGTDAQVIGVSQIETQFEVTPALGLSDALVLSDQA